MYYKVGNNIRPNKRTRTELSKIMTYEAIVILFCVFMDYGAVLMDTEIIEKIKFVLKIK